MVIGSVPHIVFVPCSKTITSILDTKHKQNISARVFLYELFKERFSEVKAYRRCRGILSKSIQDKIIDIIDLEYQRVLKKTKDPKKALASVKVVGEVLSVFEPSDKMEYDYIDLYESVLELARILDDDKNISKVVIVCNDENAMHQTKKRLINEAKKNGTDNPESLYNFEIINTDKWSKHYYGKFT